MDAYVWVSLCVRGWVAKESILSSASLDGVGLSGEVSLCAFFVGGIRAKNGVRAVPV